MKDQIQFETNGLTVLACRVPDHTYDHKLTWSDTDDRFSIDYKFSENHRGGFIMWYKDFGGRKKYPKQGQIRLREIDEMDVNAYASLFPNVPVAKRWDYLRDILCSHGIDPNDKYVLLIKVI